MLSNEMIQISELKCERPSCSAKFKSSCPPWKWGVCVSGIQDCIKPAQSTSVLPSFSDMLPPSPPHPRVSVSRLVGIAGVHAFCHNITPARFTPSPGLFPYLWIQQEPLSRKACRCLPWHRWVPTSRAPLSGWQGGPGSSNTARLF